MSKLTFIRFLFLNYWILLYWKIVLYASLSKIIKGKFKRGQNFCNACNKVNEKYEEKETDVHIAIKIIEMAMTNSLDAIVIVSGDTDLIPAVDLVRKYFPDIRLYVIFPYNRKNSAILSRISGSFKLKAEAYKRHQLPERIQNQSNLIVKPKSWCWGKDYLPLLANAS